MTSTLAVLRVDGASCFTRKSQAVPGCGAQILVATGLDKLWPAQNSAIPTAARPAQAWSTG